MDLDDLDRNVVDEALHSNLDVDQPVNHYREFVIAVELAYLITHLIICLHTVQGLGSRIAVYV